MEIRTVVEDLPEDHQGPDPSRSDILEIFLPRCRNCKRVLKGGRKRRYCNTKCKDGFHNLQRKPADPRQS